MATFRARFEKQSGAKQLKTADLEARGAFKG